MTLVGELALWVALLMALWATAVSFAGGKLARPDLVLSGQRAIYATFVMVVTASAALWYALWTHDFSLQYVMDTTSEAMPRIYVFVAFWSKQPGSMLFWTLILATYAAIAVRTSRDRHRELVPYVAATLGAVLAYFIATTAIKANPFIHLTWTPIDGRGMNPQLQTPSMALHPPNLYLGYVGTTVPFAFAVAALMIRRLDTEWLAAVRRWSIISWFFLTIGIVLGMWWAYIELGWSGYWTWDPVENVSILPWLTQTAFLHSIMIQEKRGMLRKWNVVLVVATFLLSVFGTFVTRSGLIESVHSFAKSPVSTWFASFFIVSTAVTIYLVVTRLRDIEAKVELESMMSREAAFLYNNLVLCAICFAVLWGTLFPMLSEWTTGKKITAGDPFFNDTTVPLGILLLALTGIGPLIAWRRASMSNLRRQFTVPVAVGVVVAIALAALGMRTLAPLVTLALCGFVSATIFQEFQKGIAARRSIHGENFVRGFMHLVARNRRRYGGYIVHAGIVMMFVGFTGKAFTPPESLVTLKAARDTTLIDPYGDTLRIQSLGLSSTAKDNRIEQSAPLNVWRNGKSLGVVRPAKREYLDNQKNELARSTEVALLYSLKQDVYIVLFASAGSTDDPEVHLRIAFNPLVMWIWIGGLIMAIGGLIVMWPQAERRRAQAGYAALITSVESREESLVGV